MLQHAYTVRNAQRAEGKAELDSQVHDSLLAIRLYEQFKAQGMSPAQANRAAFYAQRGLKK